MTWPADHRRIDIIRGGGGWKTEIFLMKMEGSLGHFYGDDLNKPRVFRMKNTPTPTPRKTYNTTAYMFFILGGCYIWVAR